MWQEGKVADLVILEGDPFEEPPEGVGRDTQWSTYNNTWKRAP